MADLDPRIVNLNLTPRKKDDKGNWVTLSPIKIPVRLTPNTGGGFTFDVNVAAKGANADYQQVGSMAGSTFDGGFDDNVTLSQTFGNRAGSKNIIKSLEQSGTLGGLTQLNEEERADYITQGLFYGNSKEGFLQIRQENFNILNRELDESGKNNIISRVGHENYITKDDPNETGGNLKTGSLVKPGSTPDPDPSDTKKSPGENRDTTNFDINPTSGFDAGITENGTAFTDRILSYPLDLQSGVQDFMKFQAYIYKPQELGLGRVTSRSGTTGEPDGPSVYLPINSAQDSNTVGWGDNRANPLQIGLYQLAAGAITTPFDQMGDYVAKKGTAAQKLVAEDEMIKPAVKSYFAGQAAGVSGMLSRTQGAVFNPNLVLLFNSPNLRTFSFSFRMSARSSEEATMIRKIIRYFKQTMAVKTSGQELFLKTPSVFEIDYLIPNGNRHKSIGQPKTCALTACNVNYIPDGSYMTFNDESRSMTSYDLTLNFSELEPLYRRDYDSPTDEIGF